MLLLEYPKCSTCKKAIAWLKKHELEFTDRHIKDQPPTADELSFSIPVGCVIKSLV